MLQLVEVFFIFFFPYLLELLEVNVDQESFLDPQLQLPLTLFVPHCLNVRPEVRYAQFHFLLR